MTPCLQGDANAVHRRSRSLGDQDTVGFVGHVSGSFEEFAMVEVRTGTLEGDKVGASTALHLDGAASLELECHCESGCAGSGAFRDLLRCRTVAQVDSIGFVVRR